MNLASLLHEIGTVQLGLKSPLVRFGLSLVIRSCLLGNCSAKISNIGLSKIADAAWPFRRVKGCAALHRVSRLQPLNEAELART